MGVHVQRGNGKELFVRFEFSAERLQKIRTIPGRKWNGDQRYWILPESSEVVAKLLDLFDDDGIVFDRHPPSVVTQPKANTQTSPSASSHDDKNNAPVARLSEESKRKNDSEREVIKREQNQALEQLTQQLTAHGYSPNTIEAYVGHVQRFFVHVGKVPSVINKEDILEYLLIMLDEQGRSHAYVNQAVSAIKHFYTYIIKDLEAVHSLPRVKKQLKLPDILSKEEIQAVFSKVRNIKHKALLTLTYSAGLRVSEVVSLRLEDIDSHRMLIHVRQGKGRKDRYTILSSVALEILREYARRYKLRDWLFPRDLEGQHLTERTAERVFDKARKLAKIKKDVSIHALRHSFATHLLDGGTDLRYIQELLGHKNSKTTEIYTHVTIKAIKRIRSPLDWLSPDESQENEHENET